MTGETSVQRVVQTFVHQADATLVLRFTNGERIETTPTHPFYVESQGFTPAGELGIGTSIVTRAGPDAVLASTEIRDAPATVYNFEVENTHTYFVGHSDLWVHNFCDLSGINWKLISFKTWGHGWKDHGFSFRNVNNLEKIINRAVKENRAIGRWLNDQAASEVIKKEVERLVAKGIHTGAHDFDIPPGIGEAITVSPAGVVTHTPCSRGRLVFESPSKIYDSSTGSGQLLTTHYPTLEALPSS